MADGESVTLDTEIGRIIGELEETLEVVGSDFEVDSVRQDIVSFLDNQGATIAYSPEARDMSELIGPNSSGLQSLITRTYKLVNKAYLKNWEYLRDPLPFIHATFNILEVVDDPKKVVHYMNVISRVMSLDKGPVSFDTWPVLQEVVRFNVSFEHALADSNEDEKEVTRKSAFKDFREYMGRLDSLEADIRTALDDDTYWPNQHLFAQRFKTAGDGLFKFEKSNGMDSECITLLTGSRFFETALDAIETEFGTIAGLRYHRKRDAASRSVRIWTESNGALREHLISFERETSREVNAFIGKMAVRAGKNDYGGHGDSLKYFTDITLNHAQQGHLAEKRYLA